MLLSILVATSSAVIVEAAVPEEPVAAGAAGFRGGSGWADNRALGMPNAAQATARAPSEQQLFVGRIINSSMVVTATGPS
jgi:hypothetical protein